MKPGSRSLARAFWRSSRAAFSGAMSAGSPPGSPVALRTPGAIAEAIAGEPAF